MATVFTSPVVALLVVFICLQACGKSLYIDDNTNPAKCQVGDFGMLHDLDVMDLSPKGCKITVILD
jgi:hypothetical protein